MAMTDDQHQQLADTLTLHGQQVLEGRIPEDSPPTFTLPPDGTNADGTPWWWPVGMAPPDPALVAEVQSQVPGDDQPPVSK